MSAVSTVPRSHKERIFWLCACLTAFLCGTYLIYLVIDKWKTSPVLVSFDRSVTTLLTQSLLWISSKFLWHTGVCVCVNLLSAFSAHGSHV